MDKFSLVGIIRLALAAILMAMLLGQLFTFEDFPGLLVGIGEWATVVAILLVLVELMAMPFLIGLKLPSWTTMLSQISMGLAIILLSILEYLAILSGSSILFGATFSLSVGWSVMVLAMLWILALCAVNFGPRKSQPKNRHKGR